MDYGLLARWVLKARTDSNLNFQLIKSQQGSDLTNVSDLMDIEKYPLYWSEKSIVRGSVDIFGNPRSWVFKLPFLHHKFPSLLARRHVLTYRLFIPLVDPSSVIPLADFGAFVARVRLRFRLLCFPSFPACIPLTVQIIYLAGRSLPCISKACHRAAFT